MVKHSHRHLLSHDASSYAAFASCGSGAHSTEGEEGVGGQVVVVPSAEVAEGGWRQDAYPPCCLVVEGLVVACREEVGQDQLGREAIVVEGLGEVTGQGSDLEGETSAQVRRGAFNNGMDGLRTS